MSVVCQLLFILFFDKYGSDRSETRCNDLVFLFDKCCTVPELYIGPWIIFWIIYCHTKKDPSWLTVNKKLDSKVCCQNI